MLHLGVVGVSTRGAALLIGLLGVAACADAPLDRAFSTSDTPSRAAMSNLAPEPAEVEHAAGPAFDPAVLCPDGSEPLPLDPAQIGQEVTGAEVSEASCGDGALGVAEEPRLDCFTVAYNIAAAVTARTAASSPHNEVLRACQREQPITGRGETAVDARRAFCFGLTVELQWGPQGELACLFGYPVVD